MENDQLIYRRQFIITPEKSSYFNTWKYKRIASYYLYVHPDVDLTYKTFNDSGTLVALIGYIIDPDNIEFDNEKIINKIQSSCCSIREVSDFLHNKSGRFVLIIKNTNGIYIFNDPCGLRTVYYTKFKGKILVGSQPSIFNHITGISSSQRMDYYIKSNYVRMNKEHWIPSGISLFEDVFHLIPNHYLDLNTLEMVRYWPNAEIKNGDKRDSIIKASTMLENSLMAVNSRFKLAVPITAGLDSRVILSATNKINKDIYFYTLKYRKLTSRSRDINIPRIILNRINRKHNVINCNVKPDQYFEKIYINNTHNSHLNDWGKIAYGISTVYPEDRVAVKGNCSEIFRCFYYNNGVHKKITTPSQIVSLENGWDEIQFIVDQINLWFKQSKSVCEMNKIDILDLFYWEHRMGSWQAQSQLEWDISQEVFTPFNNRRLIEIMLSIDSKYRCSPDYSAFLEIINILWPDLSRFPINPVTIVERTKKKIKEVLLKLHNQK